MEKTKVVTYVTTQHEDDLYALVSASSYLLRALDNDPDDRFGTLARGRELVAGALAQMTARVVR